MVSPQYYNPQWPVPDNVVAAVTTRHGGVSKAPFDELNLALHVADEPEAVLRNRQLLANALSAADAHSETSLLQWQWLEQVHGNRVVRVDSAQAPVTADGLITSTPGLACCVLTADCLSVFLAARDGSEVAVLHGGWRSLAADIIGNAVRQMVTPASDIVAWLGPAIGPCHFEVGGEVRDAFVSEFAGTDACFKPVAGTQKLMADLYELATMQLSLLGVSNVSGGGECTVCMADKYYSYRRSGVTGRQLSLIYVRPQP